MTEGNNRKKKIRSLKQLEDYSERSKIQIRKVPKKMLQHHHQQNQKKAQSHKTQKIST
jgi:hypothetical protein